MNKVNVVLFIALMGLLTLPYTNCSEVQFAPSVEKSLESTNDANGESDIVKDDHDDEVVTPTPTLPEPPVVPTPPPPTPEEAITNCASAYNAGSLKTAVRIVSFEDTKVQSQRSQVCEFGKNGNLSKKNNEVRARYEQVVNLNLPSNAVLCDLEMQTQLQKFKYDDTFFLMFNDRILASNLKSGIVNRLSPDAYIDVASANNVPLYRFDWMGIREASFSNVADDYCLGKDQGLGNCSWPVTEQNGDIKFEFHSELLTHLGLKADSNQQTFSFVTTGDDDENSDCYHEKLEFTMEIHYYEN